jgi:hypothetical protein
MALSKDARFDELIHEICILIGRGIGYSLFINFYQDEYAQSIYNTVHFEDLNPFLIILFLIVTWCSKIDKCFPMRRDREPHLY